VATVDGPCHLYNAWVMRHLHDPAYPLFATHFYIDPEPVPNWLIQVLLYVLLAVVPAAAAEKLLLSFYVLLFSAAAWWFAGCQARERRANAFLALPFVYNLLFHFGFYNFLFSLPLFLLAVGWWWRCRERPTWSWALALHGLLLACYFAHIVSLVMAGFVIAVLWAATFERAGWRRWLRQPLVLLPQLALPLWFVASRGASPAASNWTPQEKWQNLSELRPLFLSHTGHGPGTALALLFVVMVAATVAGARREPRDAAAARPRARHPFLLTAAVAVLVYLVCPSGMSGGGVLEPRLVLFPFLVLLPDLAPRWRRFPRAGLTVALSLLVAWESWSLAVWLGRASRGVDELLAGHSQVRPNSRVLDIVFDVYASLDRQAGGHAIGYLAGEKGLIDWNDYQAGTGYFPVRFRPGIRIPQHSELLPDAYQVRRNGPRVDFVYTRAMPPGSHLRRKLRNLYRLVASEGEGELWERRRRWLAPLRRRGRAAAGSPPSGRPASPGAWRPLPLGSPGSARAARPPETPPR